MKYFGTDGIRGEWGVDINLELSYKIGLAIVNHYGPGEYIIGRDTRVSGKAIEKSVTRGIIDGGGTVSIIGILPTPIVAYITKYKNANCGIMISASHNPPKYNGIKIFDSRGIKPNDIIEQKIESLIDSCIELDNNKKGSITYFKRAKEIYIEHLLNSIGQKFYGISVALDCAHGAASTVAKAVFEEFGIKVFCYNDSLKGHLINKNCGTMHVENLIKLSTKENIDVGFAYDGDADRLAIAIDGKSIDGDTILYNLGKVVNISKNVIVGTILSNMALELKLIEEGVTLIRTQVGDRYISDQMIEHDYSLGGEQSGHYIIRPFGTTGDAILAGLLFLKAIYKNGELSKPNCIELLPQKAISITASNAIMQDAILQDKIAMWNEKLSQNGRLVIRMSGTEPKIRVMCESTDSLIVENVIEDLKTYISDNAYRYK